jgi:hypothetical protein
MERIFAHRTMLTVLQRRIVLIFQYGTQDLKVDQSGKPLWNDRFCLPRWGGHILCDAKGFVKLSATKRSRLVSGGQVIADQYPLSDKQRAKGTKGGIKAEEMIY